MVTQPKSPLAEHERGTVEKLPSVDLVQIGGQGQDGILSVENAPGNLNMSEVGGELSRVNDSCDTKVRDDAKCQFKPSMAVAMASSHGCHASHSHSVNGKERARKAAQTLRNKDLKKTHYCHVYKSTDKKS